MTAVIVYLRASSTEQIASQQALADQQVHLQEWLADKPYAVLEQFIEIEGGGSERPRLAEAIAACQLFGLPLVIVSTQPIGAGPPFDPRIASVPVIVLPQPSRRAPQTIPCPSRCGSEVCIVVGPTIQGRKPIYLCNPTSLPLAEVHIHRAALHLGEVPMASTAASNRTLESVAPGTGELIELHNINSEGEFLDRLQVSFDTAGRRHHGVAWLRNVLNRRSPIKIDFQSGPC